MIKANKKTTTSKKTKGKPANSSSSKKPLKLSTDGKMSPKDRFKAMLEAKKKKGGKGATQKASITAKKPKVVKHKKKGRV